MSTEYGVLLMDAVVAPCATLQQAVTYSRGADREICVLDADGEWTIVDPGSYARVQVDCWRPSHMSIRRHEAAGELVCGGCRHWEAAYRRRLRGLRKVAAA